MIDEEVENGVTGAVAVTRMAQPGELERLAERVNLTYGAFGERATTEASSDTRVHGDTDLKRTISLVAGVAAASIFLAFASHPTLNGPQGWANGIRLDTFFVVVWGPLLVWAMSRVKLSRSVRTYLVLALFIEAFSETMFTAKGEGGYWDSFLWPASVAWYGTLKEFAGIPGASLPTFFFVTLGLLVRAVSGRDRLAAPPKLARNALLVFLGAVVVLSVLGIVRGGQIEWTFRQTVHMLQLPLVGLVFLYSVRVPEDLPAIGTAYVVVAVARSLIVFFVYFAVCVPKGITALPGKPEWCTNHSDSVLFVTALVILMVHGQRKKVRWTLGAAAVIVLAIVLNNRRLAFVSLGIAPLAIYLTLDKSRRKRRVTTALAFLVPLAVGYVLVGSEASSTSPVFKPARAIVSVLDQKDASSQSRDIENQNLIYTLRQSPFAPKGFGHEYEFSPENPPVDLTDSFRNYRLIAHNGVLWLWSIAGVIGFAFLWFLYPLAGVLAVRGYRASTSPLEKSSALAAFGCVTVCVIQIWGDQGMSSYLTLVTFGLAFAVAARLACQTGPHLPVGMPDASG